MKKLSAWPLSFFKKKLFRTRMLKHCPAPLFKNLSLGWPRWPRQPSKRKIPRKSFAFCWPRRSAQSLTNGNRWSARQAQQPTQALFLQTLSKASAQRWRHKCGRKFPPAFSVKPSAWTKQPHKSAAERKQNRRSRRNQKGGKDQRRSAPAANRVASPNRPASAEILFLRVGGENPRNNLQTPSLSPDQRATHHHKQNSKSPPTRLPESATNDSSDTTETSDDESESSDDDNDEVELDASALPPSTVPQLSCTNPRFLLDGKKWPALAARFSNLELANALRAYYHEVLAATPHEMKFIVDILMTFADTLRGLPSSKEVENAKNCLITGVARSIGRLEFYRAKILSGNTAAASLESSLLDEALPKAIRKARKEGKTQSRREDRELIKDKQAPNRRRQVLRQTKTPTVAKNSKRGF